MKKIAKIIDLGTLKDVSEIRANATKVKVDIGFMDDCSKVKFLMKEAIQEGNGLFGRGVISWIVCKYYISFEFHAKS